MQFPFSDVFLNFFSWCWRGKVGFTRSPQFIFNIPKREKKKLFSIIFWSDSLSKRNKYFFVCWAFRRRREWIVEVKHMMYLPWCYFMIVFLSSAVPSHYKFRVFCNPSIKFSMENFPLKNGSWFQLNRPLKGRKNTHWEVETQTFP